MQHMKGFSGNYANWYKMQILMGGLRRTDTLSENGVLFRGSKCKMPQTCCTCCGNNEVSRVLLQKIQLHKNEKLGEMVQQTWKNAQRSRWRRGSDSQVGMFWFSSTLIHCLLVFMSIAVYLNLHPILVYEQKCFKGVAPVDLKTLRPMLASQKWLPTTLSLSLRSLCSTILNSK